MAAAVVGAGIGLIGANQQKKANEGAQNQNLAAQASQNDSQWGNYLMTRGIAPTSPTTPGVLPQEGQYKVVNSRLPLWMTVNTPPPSAPKKGGFLIPRAA